MNGIIDRIILLAGGCFLLDLVHQSNTSIALLLIAMAISEFNYLFRLKWLRHLTTIACIVIGAIYPYSLVFLPLILYDSAFYRQYVYVVIGMLETLFYYSGMSTFERFFYVFLYVLLVVSSYRTRNASQLYKSFLALKDNSDEVALMMEARNRQIQENQDNQVHMAMLQERNRIAREIHDNVGHMLSRSILMVGAFLAVNKEESMKEGLSELKITLDQAMNSIRNSVHNLHDESIDLKESVNQLIKEFVFCPISLDYDMSEKVDGKVKLCFLAVLKEAQTNIIKHSNATKVEVVMREHPGIYQLLIYDNGSKKKESLENGIGLTNMQERVKSLHGTINISAENGYRIFITIPKKKG